MTIHDHFDGQAHCVECEGECQLDPEAIRVSSLIRYLLEQMARECIKPNVLGKNALIELGVDPYHAWSRARDAVRRRPIVRNRVS